MFKKILLSLCAIVVTLTAEPIDYNKLIKPLENNNIESIVKQNEQNYGNLDSFYKNLINQTNLLDTTNTLKPYLEKQKKSYDDYQKNQNEFKSFTIFYFISEETSPELIKSFTYDIQKLKELEPTIDALLLTKGLVGGSFDSMAKYVQSLQSKGISSVDITFHPWAYDYFKLDRVPAYALSYCKKDFRFKTCQHKFLAKGEISLTNFFEIVSDENFDYKKYFQKLIEAK